MTINLSLFVFSKDGDIDGIDQWSSISAGMKSGRKEFIYNLDDVNPPTEGHAAIRYTFTTNLVRSCNAIGSESSDHEFDPSMAPY